MSQVAPIDEDPPTQDHGSDNQQLAFDPNSHAVIVEANAEKDVNNHQVDGNVRNNNQHASYVRAVSKETYDKKLSNEMGTFDN